MARGAVYYHSQFKFHDGAVGEKRFVILNEPKSDEPYLVLKTTSKLHGKTYIPGCNPDRGVFFLAANLESMFELDTLVQLREIFPFTQQEILTASLKDKTLNHLGDLSDICVRQIINCIRKLKDDIRQDYFVLVTR
jgi:hypothetical protein